jgi:hypothetical protein
MSVYLLDPPALGRQVLTVRVTVMGAGTDDRYRLYLTRSACPAEPALGGGGYSPSGTVTFDTTAMTEPPPNSGSTFTALGKYRICGYLGRPNWGPSGEPLASTVTATATQVVNVRESKLSLWIAQPSYDRRSRRLEVRINSSPEAPADLTVWVTKPRKPCPSRQPTPNARQVELVVHKALPRPEFFKLHARTKFPLEASRTSGRRVCVYLKVRRPGNVQKLVQRRLKIVPALRGKKR